MSVYVYPPQDREPEPDSCTAPLDTRFLEGRDPAVRPVGLETEFGVTEPGNLYANPVRLSSQVVAAMGAVSREGGQVAWDYEAEDPLLDLRGGHLDRAAAHPSMLTDDPTQLAPSGDEPAGSHATGAEPATETRPATATEPATHITATKRAKASSGVGNSGGDMPPAPWGRRPRPSAAEAALPKATTAVLPNGARFYVDHAHPEYSAPEVLTPHDAMVWDRAGEVVARRAMAAAGAEGLDIALYKNNVDGKGAAYGSHENYLVRRDLPFDTLRDILIPFLASRQIIAGAGRVGIGERSQQPGFQITQRADYVGTDVGLQTTFNRPIVNTRDEPHADAGAWRRLHVINGDANQFEVPCFLKVATTSMVLWYLEQAYSHGWDMSVLRGLAIQGDPVEAYWAISHDPTLQVTVPTASGAKSALEIQETFHAVMSGAFSEHCEEQQASVASHALHVWDNVLASLRMLAQASEGTERSAAMDTAARDVEWVAKWHLCERMRQRHGMGWDDPRLAALDIQWADLRPGVGLAATLIAAGRTTRLATDEQIERAATMPPAGTRAAIRGAAIAQFPEVVGASWTSLLLDLPGCEDLLRVELSADVLATERQCDAALRAIDGLRTQYGQFEHKPQ